MNSNESKGCMTVVMWLSYLGFLYVAMSSMGVWVSLLAFVLMIPLIFGMGAVWNLFGGEKQSDSEDDEAVEKRKRERLDQVLRDLSDDDLMALRRRLQDGRIDDEVLYDNLVGDDGEFVKRR